MGPGRVGGRAGDGDGGALDGRTAPMLVMLGEVATSATSIVDSAVVLPPSSSLTVRAMR